MRDDGGEQESGIYDLEDEEVLMSTKRWRSPSNFTLVDKVRTSSHDIIKYDQETHFIIFTYKNAQYKLHLSNLCVRFTDTYKTLPPSVYSDAPT